MPPETEGAHRQGLFATQRKDFWWVPPAAQFLGFTAFVLYSMWVAFFGHATVTIDGEEMRTYHYLGDGANYLSPFYSPCVTASCLEGPLAGLVPDLSVAGWIILPTLFILWAPLSFRATCYYYRKMYYRAYFVSPPGCSVEGIKRDYKGEGAFPLILQNVHRYLLPFALLLIVFLAYDALLAFIWHEPDGTRSFGIGVGTILLTLNVVLLSAYTFGCHSLRHIAGGRLDCYTCPTGPNAEKVKTQHWTWRAVTWFNKRHMLWAWLSLVMVGFADLYVRLVAHGIWHDVRLI
jgi:hypothetical protein